jgi:hypothetical protein
MYRYVREALKFGVWALSLCIVRLHLGRNLNPYRSILSSLLFASSLTMLMFASSPVIVMLMFAAPFGRFRLQPAIASP